MRAEDQDEEGTQENGQCGSTCNQTGVNFVLLWPILYEMLNNTVRGKG